tara:strand:- start:461 stop:649 length:189 start_codon:yes stop_codon:yes gene_type:complete
MSANYSVRIDDKGHNFILYSETSIQIFNDLVYPTRGKYVQVTECLITDKTLAKNIIEKLDKN